MKKRYKKWLSLALTLSLFMALSTTALAAGKSYTASEIASMSPSERSAAWGGAEGLR